MAKLSDETLKALEAIGFHPIETTNNSPMITELINRSLAMNGVPRNGSVATNVLHWVYALFVELGLPYQNFVEYSSSVADYWFLGIVPKDDPPNSLN